eukprot:IDg3967t1
MAESNHYSGISFGARSGTIAFVGPLAPLKFPLASLVAKMAQPERESSLLPRRDAAKVNALAPLAKAPPRSRATPKALAPAPPEGDFDSNVSKKRKVSTATADSSAEGYDNETVHVLIKCLKDVGYGNKQAQQKNMNQVFEEAVKLAESKYDVSGSDGDDDDLYDMPVYFEYIHELERDKARHRPPATMSTASLADKSDDGSAMTSTRKRVKRERFNTMDEAYKRNTERHTELLAELRADNQHKATFNKLMAELVKKL